MKEDKKIAFYLRCSLEQDKILPSGWGNDTESDTITNQRNLLYEEAERKGFSRDRIIEYIDDGYTGVNFERPAFQRMLRDIEAGKIAVLMIKDFSRLGRNYVGVGEFIERVFPQLQIRTIAVNDRWDSEQHIGETPDLDISFKTVLYDMYSKDISVKRKSANMARNKNGIFSGGYVPYGYRKRPGDAHSLLIDPETAPIVRWIFRLYMNGEKVGDIARALNDKAIPAPGMVKMESYRIQGTRFGRNLWTTGSVRTILNNETYTGTLILNRYTSSQIRAKSLTTNPEEEWMRFPGNHKAIISRKEFEKVRERYPKKEQGESSAERNSMPLYCGHCGKKLTPTTRNEHTFLCKTGNAVPVRPCGQIEVRKEAVQNLLVKAINLQAKIFLEEAGDTRILSKDILCLEDRLDRLKREKESCHEARIDLYRQLKAGIISRDHFVIQKKEIQSDEKECQAEIESLQERIHEQEQKLQNSKIGADTLDQYAVLDHYDYDAVNHLIYRVECFNDGHLKIVWNFRSEFKNAKDVEETQAVIREGTEGHARVVIYTSDLWKMPQGEGWTAGQEDLHQYCRESLGIPDSQIVTFHDDKSDTGPFFREGYMKFLDMGRRGAADLLVIRGFRDLYLSASELNKLLRWVLPKLQCRFMSIEDHFDSQIATEREYREIYKKYRGTRRSDLMSYRMWEIRTGKRTAKEPRKPRCKRLYGYHIREDGCYADLEILEAVRQMYRKLQETESFPEVFRWLNAEGVPTAAAFFRKDEDRQPEKKGQWNSEKVWYVTKQEQYASYCKYHDRCKELGRHCERKPVVEKGLFEEVNRKCRYRNR